jgi:actin-related protein
VVDLGQSGTSCVPVFDSRPLISQASWSGVGGNVIIQHTRELLGDEYVDLDEVVIQDLIVRFGRVNNTTDEKNEGFFTYSGYGREFTEPLSLVSAIYDTFFNPDQDGVLIADKIVQAIMKCPIDTRRSIAANIVFCGGLAMVDGVQTRIMDQVRERIGEISVNLVPCAFKPNISAWVGGMVICFIFSVVVWSCSSFESV